MDRKVVFKFGARAPEAITYLKGLLANFGQQSQIEFEYDVFPNESEYSELVLTTLHGYPLDVVELGTTFVRDFLVANDLRPFRATEVQQVGRSEDFMSHLWQAGEDKRAKWAIPWLSDVRLLFYRRDLLEKAGVDEETAFNTPAEFEQTLASLQEAGVDIPWACATERNLLAIHCLLSWAWHRGGKFVDETKQKVLLDSPEIVAAMQDYFGLYRFFGKARQSGQDFNAFDAFIRGHAAVTVGGPWAFPLMHDSPDVLARTGVAPVLGHSFVGGSCLGIWKQSYHEQAAVDTIRYLTGPEFQSHFPQYIGMLPGRLDALATYPLPKEGFRPSLQRALQNGLELPAFSRWGLVESRLATAIARVWHDILAHPDPDINALVATHMAATTRRINALLAQHVAAG
ncbi:MAG: extracellular solute-binding protein [Chloroflexota bacterium]